MQLTLLQFANSCRILMSSRLNMALFWFQPKWKRSLQKKEEKKNISWNTVSFQVVI